MRAPAALVSNFFFILLPMAGRDINDFRFSTVKQPAEATLRGHEYFFYDMAANGGEPIVSSSDEISLYFKTRQATGMLFYTGNNSAGLHPSSGRLIEEQFFFFFFPHRRR